MMSLHLSASETETYASTGPDGDQIRRAKKAEAIALSAAHDCCRVEVYSHDGITYESLRAERDEVQS